MTATITVPRIDSADLRQRLTGLTAGGPSRGATLTPDWLPSGLSDAVDELREHHRRVLAEVRTADAKAHELRRAFRAEDEQHDAEQRSALRDGREPKDSRTPAATRVEALRDAEARIVAAVEVAGEVAADVVAELKRSESVLLAEQAERVDEARRKREQAAQLLAEARRQEWAAERACSWILDTADDERGPFGRQPFPEPADAPERWQPRTDKIGVRPWHRQPEARALPEPMGPSGGSSARTGSGPSDPLGVAALDPTDERADLIEPLDEEDRYVRR